LFVRFNTLPNARWSYSSQSQDLLNPSVLAQASPPDQKQMLGERLFPLIQQTHPELAGKITGMLLEIDNAELLHMLEFREALAAKVEKAVSVLQAHQAGPGMSGQTFTGGFYPPMATFSPVCRLLTYFVYFFIL
jgi:hypothetical protein